MDKVPDRISSSDVEIVVKKDGNDEIGVIGVTETTMNEEKKAEEMQHKPEA